METTELPKQLSTLVPFNRHVGIEVIEVATGRGIARLVDSPAVANHVGTLHAGALFTLAEAASGAAIVGTFADAILRLSLVMRDAYISYRRPARGTVTASATPNEDRAAIEERLDRDGRADTSVAVSLTDEHGVEVACAHAVWHLRRR